MFSLRYKRVGFAPLEKARKKTQDIVRCNPALRKDFLTGFTLVEVLSTIFIGIFLLTIVLTVYVSYIKLYATQSNLADAERNNSFIMHKFTSEIRSAKNIHDSYTVNGTLFITGTSTIILEYPVFDAGNNLVPNVSNFGAIYVDPGDSGNLILSLATDPSSSRTTGTYILGNYVETLLLRYNTVSPAGASNITVFLTTRSVDMPRGDVSVTKTNSVSLRND